MLYLHVWNISSSAVQPPNQLSPRRTKSVRPHSRKSMRYQWRNLGMLMAMVGSSWWSHWTRPHRSIQSAIWKNKKLIHTAITSRLLGQKPTSSYRRFPHSYYWGRGPAEMKNPCTSKWKNNSISGRSARRIRLWYFPCIKGRLVAECLWRFIQVYESS